MEKFSSHYVTSLLETSETIPNQVSVLTVLKILMKKRLLRLLNFQFNRSILTLGFKTGNICLFKFHCRMATSEDILTLTEDTFAGLQFLRKV